MTRPSRMLLVMALLAIGGVAALAWMAQRYSAALSTRAAAYDGRTGGTAWQSLPGTEAERLVGAYLGVRAALAGQTGGESTEPREDGPSVQETLRAALAAQGLTLDQYRELDRLAHAWQEGADVPAAYRAALDRRRESGDIPDLSGK